MYKVAQVKKIYINILPTYYTYTGPSPSSSIKMLESLPSLIALSNAN